ncbi:MULTISPECIES: extensin-like domain-containing protein [Gammaproteobacteria]|uniref:extensin-like domain-containing protein n=1 Tax=Gammaproteobacteria TaxID=1236 RepID=UPI0019146765|nr:MULTISPECIES: extensin family protein [Gammaproteobacteria]MBK5300453.1 extensin family protein [Bacillus sp. TH86]MBK5320222.1 extensin family protein [Bacillus sp. TH59]MBK5335172.1 extensin family protein [Bacillus sp. TH57]MBK5309260.1 extensin family protein [Pseudomonas sp. TH71]MBK5314721.1 extensin family protein [Erwinia sp. TH79]
MRFRWGLLLVLLIIGAAGLSVWRGWVSIPPQWNPWAPLDVKAEPNLLTRYKLMRLRDDPQLCDHALSSSGLRVSHQADSPDAACPLTNTLRVQGGEAALSSSFLASCSLAVAFALFERHALQPAAQAVYGQAVKRVDHLGSFACRNVYNRENGRRSQHATADALDISGFRLADGRFISVLKDWPKDNQDARFLHQVRDGACDMFSVVLSPDYNAAHRNHFHVDVGPWWRCR